MTEQLDRLAELKVLAEELGVRDLMWQFYGRDGTSGEQIWQARVGRRIITGGLSTATDEEFVAALERFKASRVITC